MKKFFAFAMAIVSMAAVMTSCNNDNAEFVEQKAPTGAEVQDAQEMKDISLVVAVTSDQMNYFDEIYTIQTPNKVQTVKVSEMEPATEDEIKVLQNAIELTEAYSEVYGTINLEFYSIHLGQVNTTLSTKILSHELMVKANHPTEQYSYLNAAGLCFDGKLVSYNTKHDIRLFKDNYGDDANVKGFADVLNQYSK